MQRLKQAELKVAQAARERDFAKTSVDHFIMLIDQACQSDMAAGTLINPSVRSNLTEHVERLRGMLSTAQERLKVSEQRFRETERVRAEIHQEAEGFTQLRKLRAEEHQDEVNRRQQIELDEVVMRKWSVNSADDDSPPTGFT
jgi:flagellar biosynthesis chaperone FliJ